MGKDRKGEKAKKGNNKAKHGKGKGSQARKEKKRNGRIGGEGQCDSRFFKLTAMI